MMSGSLITFRYVDGFPFFLLTAGGVFQGAEGGFGFQCAAQQFTIDINTVNSPLCLAESCTPEDAQSSLVSIFEAFNAAFADAAGLECTVTINGEVVGGETPVPGGGGETPPPGMIGGEPTTPPDTTPMPGGEPGATAMPGGGTMGPTTSLPGSPATTTSMPTGMATPAPGVAEQPATSSPGVDGVEPSDGTSTTAPGSDLTAGSAASGAPIAGCWATVVASKAALFIGAYLLL